LKFRIRGPAVLGLEGGLCELPAEHRVLRGGFDCILVFDHGFGKFSVLNIFIPAPGMLRDEFLGRTRTGGNEDRQQTKATESSHPPRHTSPPRFLFTRQNGGVIIAILTPKRSESNSRKIFVFIYEMVSGSFPFHYKCNQYGNTQGHGG